MDDHRGGIGCHPQYRTKRTFNRNSSVRVDLASLVERAEVIAVVSPIARPAGAKLGNPEFKLLKLRRTSGKEAAVPNRFTVGPAYKSSASAEDLRPDPSGMVEAPVVLKYDSSLSPEQLANAKQIIVFLTATSSDQVPFRFAIDNAVEAVARLAEVRTMIARLRLPAAP